MIGKQIKGRSFSKLLNYLFSKDGAILIGSNMEGTMPQELAVEFRFSQQLNPRVNRVVYHASLSLPHSEHLENDIWHEIAQKYLQAMGFDMNQYAVVRHRDRGHDHAHIVASRVRLDGTTVSDSWDYRRSEAVIRQLERDYGLRCPIISEGDSLHASQAKDSRSPTTGERRLLARTGEASVRVQLQRSLDQATQNSATLSQLVEQLQQQGISVRVNPHQTGEIKGISYKFNGIAFSGTHLGKAYTFIGLQKYRGVNYDSVNDAELIKTLIDPPIHSSTKMNSSSGALVQVSNMEENQRNDHIAKDRRKSKLPKHPQRELEL